MGNFLFVAHPTIGHVYPLLSIAIALHTKGHQVAFYTDKVFAQEIIATGITFCEPIKWQGVNVKLPPEILQNLEGDIDLSALIMQYKVMGSIEMLVEDVEHYIQQLNSQIIVCELFLPGVGMAANRAKVPWASVATCPVPVLNGYKEWFPDSVWPLFDNSNIYQKLKLPSQSSNLLGQLSPFLHLVPTTPTFAGKIENLPNHIQFVGPLLSPNTTKTPNWIQELSHLPNPILVTASTAKMITSTLINKDINRYIQAVITGLANEATTVIITLPSGLDPNQFNPLPTNIRLESFVPHQALMPYLKAVITHGGWGIIGRSLMHGLPLVVVPFISDQPINAVYCEQRGVGITVPVDKITPERLREAVFKVLNEPSYRAKAQEEAEIIHKLNPLQASVKHLEALLECT